MKTAYSNCSRKTGIGYTPNQTYSVEVVAQGSTLKINIDGRSVFSVTDISFPRGTVALYSSYNAGSFFDDVLVQDLTTKTVLIWNDFNSGNFTVNEAGTNSGPSKWAIVNGTLVQSSNIGSDVTGKPGTFLLY